MTGRLARLRHLIVDETQDLVADRALCLIELVSCLSPQCGVTILTTKRRRYTGFAGSSLAAGFSADTVAAHFLETLKAFRRETLEEIHRTGETKLLRLFADARMQAVRETANPKRKLARLRRTIRRRAQKIKDDPARRR